MLNMIDLTVSRKRQIHSCRSVKSTLKEVHTQYPGQSLRVMNSAWQSRKAQQKKLYLSQVAKKICRDFPGWAQEEHLRWRHNYDVVAMRTVDWKEKSMNSHLAHCSLRFRWKSFSSERIISSLQIRHNYLPHKAVVGLIEIN